jgi:hypothetical protein
VYIVIRENENAIKYIPMIYGMRPENVSEEMVYNLQNMKRQISTTVNSILKKILTGKITVEVAEQFLTALKQCDDTS